MDTDFPGDNLMGAMENSSKTPSPKPEALSFQTLVDKHQTLQAVLMLAALQVYPSNHRRNFVFQEAVRDVLRVLKKNEKMPDLSWVELQEILRTHPANAHQETPWNSFTSNVIYRNGNNIVYPGSQELGVQNLNDIVVGLTLVENDLPEAFKTLVLSAIGILLEISNQVARALGHKRYMDIRNESGQIEFPSYEEGMEMVRALSFTPEQIERICSSMEAKPEIFNHFLLDPDSQELQERDPDDNVVLRKPFLKIDGAIFLYMPTGIISALIDFVYKQADQHGCKAAFLALIHKVQKNIVLESLKEMKWEPLSMTLPEDPFKLFSKELLCQFDRRKVAYVCFRDNTPLSKEARKSKDPFNTRIKQVLEYLRTKHPETEMLTLIVIPETESETMVRWGKPVPGSHTLMLGVHELELIANRDEVNRLSLWKFAKALSRAGTKIKLIGNRMIVLYGYYERNGGSLLHPTKANTGTVSVDSTYASRLFIEHDLNRDIHAVMTRIKGTVGFLYIYRSRKYAPIYKPLSWEGFVLIENSFATPVWIMNNQEAPKGARNWGHDIGEAIAFWLFKLSPFLKPSLDKEKYHQYDIEVKVDDKLLKAKSFVIPSELPDQVDLFLEVTPDLITIHIPFSFGLLAWRPDNRADKTLIKTAIMGIIKCSELRGHPVVLNVEELDKIIAEHVAPDHAKMILFGDAYDDPRYDRRNVPVFYPIHQADEALILEDLLSYLPAGYVVPENVGTREEKLKLLDDLIEGLLSETKRRLSEYNGTELLFSLIQLNEACTRKKEFEEILRPAQIACFSTLEQEVKKIEDSGNDLVASGHALRTLIEFTGTNLPTGSRKPGYDDIGELMAMAGELMYLGQFREIIENNLTDLPLGRLPSGRLFVDTDFHKRVFEPLQRARAQGKVLSEQEFFGKRYAKSDRTATATGTTSTDLNEAFVDEFGFSCDQFATAIFALTAEGFEKAEVVVIRSEAHLIQNLMKKIPELDQEKAKRILDFLTLPIRPEVVFSKNEKNEYDKQFVPWRYNRPFSFLMKPLVKVKDSEGNYSFYYGYRQLHVTLHHYLYLVFNAKLPSPSSKKMKSLLGSISGEMGKPFEEEVREWLRKNTTLDVQPLEIYPSKLSKRSADKELGDIDVFAVDHVRKIIYSIECKNTRAARNIIEMVGEMNVYLGKEATGEKPKISRHYDRDKWLKSNLQFLSSLVPDAEQYTVKSLVLTADELSVEYLGGSRLLLPVLSFSKLKLEGITALEKL